MKKLIFFFFLVFFIISSASAQNIQFWYADVTVSNSLIGTSSIQKAYFFKDLSSLGKATGFPLGDRPGGGQKTSYDWRHPVELTSHMEQIYSIMRRDGFGAAFVQVSSGTSVGREPYWNYGVYIIWNGITYYDLFTRYDKPVEL